MVGFPETPGIARRDRVSAGPQPALASAGDAAHLTLEDLHQDLVELKAQLPAASESSELRSLSRKLRRQQKLWVPVAWVVSLVGMVFSAGMAWAVFAGANATDAEVDVAVENAIKTHNQGALEHPKMGETLEAHSKEIKGLKGQTKALAETQGRLDRRSLYQFEFSRWQAGVIECARNKRCRRPPGKPEAVRDLETELMND